MGSRSDQLFHKRKAERKKFAKKSVPSRIRVLIVCEGEKTEPGYFKFLRKKLDLTAAVIVVSGESDSAPGSVVKFGRDKLKMDPDYQYVFFVFDKDSHENYDGALQSIRDMGRQPKYKKITISAITSNPCFELWYLLHIRQFEQPCSAGGGKSACENLISILKKQRGFENYKKSGQQHFDLLDGKLPMAKKRTLILLAQCRNAGDPEFHGNPSTYVHELVAILEKLAVNQHKGEFFPPRNI